MLYTVFLYECQNARCPTVIQTLTSERKQTVAVTGMVIELGNVPAVNLSLSLSVGRFFSPDVPAKLTSKTRDKAQTKETVYSLVEEPIFH